MGTDIALKTVLVHLVMLESLRPMEVAIAVAATESLDVAMRQQVSFELVRPRKLTHAAQVVAERAFEPLCQIMDQHMSAQSIFPLESGRAMLRFQI